MTEYNTGLFRVAVAAALLLTTHVHATNGYFTHGVGTHNKAMAGAGTASPDQAIDAATNPAAAILVGDRLDLGLALFSPQRDYQTSASQINGNFGAFTVGPNSIDSDNDVFPIPYAAKAWQLDNDRAIALMFYGRGGMNTEYNGGTASFSPDGPGPLPVFTFPGTFGAGRTGVDLSQAFLELAYAGKQGSLAWGIAPVLAAQVFEATGVGNFAGFTRTFAASGGTVMPQNLTDRGHDWSFGYGIKLGVIWQASGTISLGLSYQSRLEMDDFDKYSDLFARSGGFDIPASTRLGLSWQTSDALQLHFDIEHSQFGDVDSVGNPMAGIVNCPTAGFGGTNVEACLGGKEGMGFGWDDMTTYKLGAKWSVADLPGWIFRAGVSYGEQPIPESDAVINILAPAVPEQHFTFGVSHERENGHEWSLSLMYAPENEETGPNFFDPTQQVKLSMSQFELEFSYSW